MLQNQNSSIKVWAISDTHGKHKMLNIPSGIDLLIFAGDIGTVRDSYENNNAALDFIEWIESLEHIPHKVWIAGNHDTAIGRRILRPKDLPNYVVKWTYLEHDICTLKINGRLINIFGSPYTPTFGHDWAFNVPRHKLDAYWKDIPDYLDILITHGPPRGILDMTKSGVEFRGNNEFGNVAAYSCGCGALLRHVKRSLPKYHIFGHIHSEKNFPNAGIMKPSESGTTFVNASVLDLNYQLHNHGFIFTI